MELPEISIPEFPFALERPLLFFDVEATGPNPGNDRVVELGILQFVPGGPPRHRRTYVNPGVAIPYEATYGKPDAVEGKDYTGHGITDAMVADAPSFADLASSLLVTFSNTDFGGYNIRGFDLPIMASEFERVGIKNWSWDDAKLVDSFRLWQVLSRRTLADAVRLFLNEELEGAHGAVADIVAALRVAISQIGKLPNRPDTLAALHELCYPRDPNAVDPGGKILYGPDGDAIVNFGKKWKGLKLRMMKRRDLEWIVDKADGMSPTVKAICRDAIMGKFPTKEGTCEALAVSRDGTSDLRRGDTRGQNTLFPEEGS